MTLSLPLVLSTFGVIFFAELPDKTALASLVLATRYPGRQVVAGAWLAFLVQTLVAVAAGSVLALLPARPVRIAAGIGFLVFAVLALRENEAKEEEAEEEQVRAAARARRPAWVTCFVIVFAAEWGDLTQLATAALVAHTGDGLSVALGAIPALWAVTLLAATAGSRLGRLLPPRILQRASAVVFAVVGVVIIASALLATGR